MQYYSAIFHLKGDSLTADIRQSAMDLVAALAAETGFESFEQTEDELIGYVRADLLDQESLSAILGDFPIPGVTVDFTLEEAENKDWNAEWEEAGFDPIVIDGQCVIHDTKHTVDDAGLMDIVIDAKMAFGTGTHDTTRLMVGTLLASDLKGKRVLDCGCGTGILSIAALKCGASSVVAYDIDEWSVENTLHNAQLNQVENIEVLLGDIHVLSHVSGMFDYVLANINRNILLADLPSMCEVLVPGGSLIISGFYEEDTALLVEKAKELGLTLQSSSSSGNWKMLSFCS